MKIEEKHQCKLLVEGNTDQHVIWSLCNYYDVIQTFDVIDCDGVDKLFKQLQIRLTNLNDQIRLGVVLDADTNYQGRIDALQSIIGETNKIKFGEMSNDGLVINLNDSGTSKLGIWIMPNNHDNGMIEDFAIAMVPSNDVLMLKAEKTIEDIERDSIARYRLVHRSKAKIHTFLAWNDEPGMPLGQAITKRVLSPKTQSAVKFVGWLNRLFNE